MSVCPSLCQSWWHVFSPLSVFYCFPLFLQLASSHRFFGMILCIIFYNFRCNVFVYVSFPKALFFQVPVNEYLLIWLEVQPTLLLFMGALLVQQWNDGENIYFFFYLNRVFFFYYLFHFFYSFFLFVCFFSLNLLINFVNKLTHFQHEMERKTKTSDEKTNALSYETFIFILSSLQLKEN